MEEKKNASSDNNQGKKYKKTIIGIVALFLTVMALWEACDNKAGNKVDNMVSNKVDNKVWKEKWETWNNTYDPSLRVKLLKSWNKRGDIPTEMWNKFNLIDDVEVLIAMASHPWVPKDIKDKFLSNEDARVRYASILNKRFRMISITLLSKDRRRDVREIVASNSNTPVELLKYLGADSSSEVASNSNTPVDILKKLATNRFELVRSAVAGNSNTPVDLLKILATDIKHYVRKGAISSLISRPESEWEEEW